MSNIVEIPDPRSPTVAFVRTPLRVVKMIIDEENISTETRINNEVFENALSGNLLMSSPIVSNTFDTDDSFHSAVGENDIEPLISSTDSKGVKDSNKKNRRALGCIKNRLIETPKTDMRRKLWRNMEDERVKKGVNNGVENTPPLPFMDLTASAPPKLYRHRKFT
ncbi:uncharacterized protein LOC132952131 [Metopolophium dirhodum]|uniref:uncharacterized protein LOC132952131 n=1 Tax=Metopolophium dirhodum TaxID=44670 RepID=UPI00298F78ED|nr:uncharacterized protein LOC132952131 [Metopolophium dirhodum]XP_060880282.1 uncharacterized protein LOC132952131 [Metopolophium dirhodum]XP_060880283.1 uncharacterized protein LOC132952131 [Metopolophium dirhodum]XP_060880284.1 uncharacterized protein LOC132952131 [Metopolophium dirhodum]